MQLRPYQQEAVDKTIEILKDSWKNVCIVAPTGSGKSLILAELVNKMNLPTLILSHRKEILEQNEEKIRHLAPHLPTGIYSASLNRKEIKFVTIAQIQSIAKRVDSNLLDPFKFVIVDECHLIPPDAETQYRKVLNKLKEAYVVGLTATPMRLNGGSIIGENKIFELASYEIKIPELIKDGFLCPLVGKSSVVQADLTGVQKRGGDYVLEQARQKIDIDSMTISAIQECLKYASNRKSWIVFCSGVEHAAKVSTAFNNFGITNKLIVGDTLPLLREQYIKEFKENKIRMLVNAEVLTTGFDAPQVDCIVLLRATASTSLYQQILGRGMRPHPSKENCLVLDFCGNLERHGPIDLINYKDFEEIKKGDGEPPGKICPQCRTLVHASVRECGECGYEFPKSVLIHESKASDLSPLSANDIFFNPVMEFTVLEMIPELSKSKSSGEEMLVINYRCSGRNVKEYVLFDNKKAFVKQKVKKWWRERTIDQTRETPIHSREAYYRFQEEGLRIKSIWVKKRQVKKEEKVLEFFEVIGAGKEMELYNNVNDEILF